MPDHSLIAGLVLAGGDSRRFGANKLLADFNGTTMVEHVFGLLSALLRDVHVSVSDDAMLPVDLRTREIRDIVSGIGPLGGVYSGFLELNADWLVVLAGDLPYLTTHSIRRLIEKISKSSVAIVACDSSGRPQPLVACYHRSALPAAKTCIAAGQYAMKHFTGRLEKVEYVSLPDHELTNVNRPEDIRPRSPHPAPRTPHLEPRTQAHELRLRRK